jgi:hypothetical protein
MDKHKLILPICILLGAIILGGFYFASQESKQKSIERQQLIDLQAKKDADQAKFDAEKAKAEMELQAKLYEQQAITDKENAIATKKSACVQEAEAASISQYEKSDLCTGTYAPITCKDGVTYLVSNYNNYYDTCLQRKGLK